MRFGMGGSTSPGGTIISVAFAGRQAGVERGFRNCGIRARHQTPALEPQPERFPMDRYYDFEGDERQREERPQQAYRSRRWLLKNATKFSAGKSSISEAGRGPDRGSHRREIIGQQPWCEF